MDVKILGGSLQKSAADIIIVPVLETSAGLSDTVGEIDKLFDGLISALVEEDTVTGKPGQVETLYPQGKMAAGRVILVGVGSAAEITPDAIRRAAATGLQQARKAKAQQVAFAAADLITAEMPVDGVAQAVAEGALMGLYTYHGQKSTDAPENTLKALEIVLNGDQAAAAEAGKARGIAFANGAMLARDLVNLPPNICNPAYLADRAKQMAEAAGLRCEVLEEHQMRALKMGALLGVAQGSKDRPRFIIMEHNAERAEELKTLVLVGKGVTFDTGGYSLKTRDGMIGMKADMGGGAAVIGAMQIVAGLDLPLHVVGLVPASDNMISDGAYRPQEVVTAGNGKTIEIISTDAEGRMLLADALVYAKRYGPDAVVDIATLTGACIVALGNAAAGVFSTDAQLAVALSVAGEETGERVWHMPIFPEYTKAIESDTADMKNSGGRLGGAGVAAAFLSNFVDYPLWAHVDMAGMMLDAADNPTVPTKGATGYGARLLAEWVRRWA